MKKEIVNKNYLDADDVSEIFGTSKSNSYQIIRGVNDDERQKGHSTFNGKVLAPALYRKYGLDNYLAAYLNV